MPTNRLGPYVVCDNCGRAGSEHCDVHLIPCCPGKCPGPDGQWVYVTKRDVEEAAAVGEMFAATILAEWGGGPAVAPQDAFEAVPKPEISEAEAERIIDKRVMARLRSDGAYRNAGSADEQSAAADAITAAVEAEVASEYRIC